MFWLVKIKFILLVIVFAAVGYPIWVWFQGANLVWNEVVLFDIFPVLGLIAFSTMWLHIVGGAFRQQLEKYINFERFVEISSIIVFISLVLHPLLLIVALKLTGGGSIFDFTARGQGYLIWIAIIAWVIFIAYDILKVMRKKNTFVKHWQTIKLISTLAFFLALFHSLGIGRDLQLGPLRAVWVFYGITAAIATVYSYFIKPNSQI